MSESLEIDHTPAPEPTPGAAITPTANGDSALPPPPVDRWAHRRTEPRPFAVLWLCYLLACAVLAFGTRGILGNQSTDTYRHSARIMLALHGAGIGLLWPMVRFSQSWPTRPRAAALADIFIVLVSVEVSIIPQSWHWMANWPPEVLAALCAAMGAWVILIGGLIATAGWFARRSSSHGTPQHALRVSWMLGVVALCAVGPCIGWLADSSQSASSALVASPISAAGELTRNWPGRPRNAQILPVHWVAIAAISATAALVWVLLAVERTSPARVANRDQPA